MKRSLVLLAGFILCFNLYGQNDTSYIHTFGGIQNDGCKQIQPTPDGGYITIGTTNTFGAGNTDFYVIKTDSLCNFQWSRTYGGPLNEEGFSVTTTLDSGYAFVGFTNSYGAGGYDVFLVKTDSKGNVQWQKTYGGSNWDFGYSVQQVKDSGYVICGLTYSYGVGNGNMYIIRTDKNGDTLWTKTAGGNGHSVANALAVREDSLYIIAGNTTSYGIGDTNAILLQLNDKGDIEWTRVFGDSTNKTFNSVQLTPDNGFVMYGQTDSIPGSTTKDSVEFEFLTKTDSAGNLLLIAPGLLPSAKNGVGADARQLSDGSFLTLGCNASFGSGALDFHAFNLSSGGWFNIGPTFGGEDNEIASSIAIGKNGDVVLAGSSDTYPTFSVGLYDVFLVRREKGNLIVLTVNDTVVKRYLDTTEGLSSISIQKQAEVGVNVFPNPVAVSATILVQGNDFEKYTYTIFNINGQCVINNNPLKRIGHGQSMAIFNKGELSAGEYMYEIISGGCTKVASGKIILK